MAAADGFECTGWKCHLLREAGACSSEQAAEAFPALCPQEVLPGPHAAWLVPHPFVPEQRSLKVKNNTDPSSVMNSNFKICS